MELREEYKKETGYDALYEDDRGCVQSEFCYTKWLESKILKLQQVKNNDLLHSVSGMFISTDYLMGLHPELNREEADSLKEYANSHTIMYRECYGDGSIIYHRWKEANYR